MRAAIAAGLICAACAPPIETIEAVTAPRSLVGVPVDGYPNYVERQLLLAINRGRAAPNDVAAGNAAACSEQKNATVPLMLDLAGSKAARFHSLHSTKNMGGLTHSSYCTLRQDIAATNCDGAAACACEPGSECFSCTTLGGCGTSFSARTALFGFGANGEVGAAGYGDGFAAVRGWITECPPQDGHRQILTGGDKDAIGLGHADGGSCWSSFQFGDTAFLGVQTAVLPSGVHVPETGGAGTTFDFYVNYYSAAGGAQDVSVVIDGECTPMSIELGEATNATYKLALEVGAGCHQYYFVARDSTGATHSYPEAGAWGVGECSDYTAMRMDADCGLACPDADGDQVTTCAGDCNDGDPAVHPGAPELCNELDDNCNATDDEGCACTDGDSRSCGFNEGACELGLQTCTSGQWGPCIGGEIPDGGCGVYDGGNIGELIDSGVPSTDPPDAGEPQIIGPPPTAARTKAELRGACGCGIAHPRGGVSGLVLALMLVLRRRNARR